MDKKTIMYAIIRALESDFVELFAARLQIDDIPPELRARSNRVLSETNEILSYLMGLDIQAYIEISNKNIDKLQITAEQRRFLNTELVKLIPIRNRVMHPRPIEVTDLPITQSISNEICKLFQQFTWNNLTKTLMQIDNDPSVLQLPPFSSKKNEKIIENLPAILDFDETSFIGRRREIGDVRDKLKKRNVHVLSIIGDGGVGKTALTIKLLYDMLDEPNCPFELILWVSLKTNELTGYEFKKIEDAITTTAEMYNKLGEFVGLHNHNDVPSYLIELAQNFNTLLVLDNLETINSSDVKEFIDSFSEFGKVLITSRIGLGEMEHRYRLEGLNSEDVQEYMNILLELYGMPGLLTTDQKNAIAKDELHSNPLAIKWFVKSLYNCQNVDKVLSHKDDLITFCMSNVYEKLSTQARNILEFIQIANLDLSYGELVYYTDSSVDDMVKLSLAINELIKCNFLDNTKYRTNNLLSITEFASEFLRNQITIPREKTQDVRDKQKKLTQFIQQLEQKKSSSPASNDTFHFYGSNKNRIVAAYYLSEAVEAVNAKKSTEEALEYANIAKKIAPDYSEVYIVLGLCYANNSPEKARLEYENALGYSQSESETATIHTRYARFLRSNNMYQEAIDHLEIALALNPDDYIALFELIMSLGWVNKFDRAEQLLHQIDITRLSDKQRFEYSMRQADLLRRKADTIPQAQSKDAFVLLKEAYHIISADETKEKRKYDMISSILVSLSHLYLNNEIEDFIIQLLDRHYHDIRNTQRYKRFQEVLSGKITLVSDTNQEKLLPYIIDTNRVLQHIGNKEGVIIQLHGDYGFMRVNSISAGIYFKASELVDKLKIGDVVTYEKIIKDGKGFMAVDVRFKCKANEIITPFEQD